MLQRFSLSHPDAPKWNKAFMLEFQAALKKDPAADLMSMFSDSYRRHHQCAERELLSYPAGINRQMLDELDNK